MVGKLEEILNIPDRQQRLEILLHYLNTLRLDPSKAKNDQGEYVEEKLVLMAYDALQQKKTSKAQDSLFILGGVIFLIGAAFLIRLMPGVLTGIYKQNEAEQEAKQTVIQGFDKDGKPVLENNEPVRYELMDGEYTQYDKNGKLKYEYFYDKGRLARKLEFDTSGKVVFNQVFSAEGTQ